LKSKTKINIIQPQTPQEFEVYYLMRYTTLRKPWNQPIGSEKDEMEESSIHLMAIDEHKTALGVCRLQFNSSNEAQLRYMGVIDTARNMGIGRLLLNEAEKIAKNKSCQHLLLQARDTAIPFYEKCGYSIKEKSYLMWNQIQHFLMAKKLN
jgi:predicted GNAT family N-acyltransferase